MADVTVSMFCLVMNKVPLNRTVQEALETGKKLHVPDELLHLITIGLSKSESMEVGTAVFLDGRKYWVTTVVEHCSNHFQQLKTVTSVYDEAGRRVFRSGSSPKRTVHAFEAARLSAVVRDVMNS